VATGAVGNKASGFLSLTEQKRVARIDLAEAGYEGVYFVCDLTATQQQTLLTPKGGTRMRKYTDGSFDVDMASMPPDASPKFLMACLVSDEKDGEILERAFEATEEPFIVFPKGDLVWLADEWRKEMKEPAVRQTLEGIPSAVSQLIVNTVLKISGIEKDAVEEKKES
jgi:hypothetical protein